MKKVSVLGCGWLGKPLAKRLFSQGYEVNGSTTSANKIPLLAAEGIHPFLIQVQPEGITGPWEAFVQEAHWLIVDIPPSIQKQGVKGFVTAMQQLCLSIEKTDVSKIILVSSTSVFADKAQVFTEEDTPEPDSENGLALREVEKMFQKISSASTTILRFGGLIGADRHPVKHLAGRTGISAPLASVNLIHQSDCIEIILQILAQNKVGEVFHGVSPEHPTRQAYYTQKALEFGLDVPVFKSEDKTLGKTINSVRLTSELGYQFIKPTL